ncbi:MAG TPA: ABC transporter permease subunit, partial [Actinomycetes bacterium]|nr:ABC transporter permease subunit [Actinomycetes bacterium]
MIVAARLVRDRRWLTLWWALGFVGLTFFTVALYPSIKGQPSIEELLANMPQALRSAIGYDAAVPLSSPAAYLQARLFSTLAPLLAVVFGIGAGARAIGGSEEAGTLELLLANPVTRGRVL